MSRSGETRAAGGRAAGWRALLLAACLLPVAASPGDRPWASLGRTAAPAEIAAWDIDVGPDGTGLPPGRGSVAEGRDVYDAKCASCHGEFGDSNQYLQLAGGVGSLATDNPVRTTGSKLNHATTLWDYINRAMPFQAPKSLSADEVYALTAYVLHLNDILPEDAALDEQSILLVKMPNRDGFTTDHGFMTRDGAPDVREARCMSDCGAAPVVTSTLPAHARNAHGRLTDQMRTVGPYRGADTSRPAPSGPLAAAALVRADTGAGSRVAESAAALARTYGCTACHGIAEKVIGPGFREVAARYRDQPQAHGVLMSKVRAGGGGAWGNVEMPAQPHVPEADLAAIVAWVLAGARTE
jgi:cytochrome c